MCPAACSWWTEIVWMRSRTSYRASRRPMFPWPLTPKANSTPSHSSRSTMTCAPVLASVMAMLDLRPPSIGDPSHVGGEIGGGQERRPDVLHQPSALVRLVADALPLRIGLERAPSLLPVLEGGVPGDVDELVLVADDGVPESHDVDAVLVEELHRVLAESRQHLRLAARHALVDAQLVDHANT